MISRIAPTLLLLLLPLVNGCSVPPGGCADCENLEKGVWMGTYEGPANTTISSRGSGSLNYERYKTISGRGVVVGQLNVGSYSQCCQSCAEQANCYFWHYFPSTVPLSSYPKAPTKNCYLIAYGYPGTDNLNTKIPPSYLGGKCNGAPAVLDDPHFTGAHGTRFDFNGEVDKSFCLITDTRIHLNALLGGYVDNNPVGATERTDGKAIRTWIKDVAIMWRDDSGQEHSAFLHARRGNEQGRGAHGFLESLRVDRDAFEPPLAVGDAVLASGGFSLVLLEQGRRGVHDMDTYVLRVGSRLEMRISMRVAHRALQTPQDAQAHFNLNVVRIDVTDDVHGVLGQTYREDPERLARAIKYSQLSQLLHGPVVADGQSGRGFLDGNVEDYETSSLHAPDCKFAGPWMRASLQ